MNKVTYEGYTSSEPDILLREKFEQANIYATNARSLLNKASGFISAYDFTLNPYRGCHYGCSYCYAAAFSPNSKMRDDWGNWVIVKQNAVELLTKELERWYKKHPQTPPSIYMSSVTDPYQPIEAKQQLTRQLLEVMIIYQPTLVIQTRSPMITRDIDLLREFRRLRVNMSVPTGSEAVRKDFEPRSASVKARLQAISKLRYNISCNEKYEAKFAVTITPLLPTLGKDEKTFFRKLESLDRVVIQEFHPSNQRSLIASTREEALELKKKYSWWYDNEQKSYREFQRKLTSALTGVEIKEGKSGFSYD